MNLYKIDQARTKTLINYDYFTFSGGEEHVLLDANEFIGATKIVIYERLTNSSKLMRLMMTLDAIERITNKSIPVELVAPYFPYARQDRVCVKGEALGASVMATFINNLNFTKVTIWDAHSDVSPALLNNVNNIPQIDILETCTDLKQALLSGGLTLISPDAGASKKTLKISETFNGNPEVIQTEKVRDLKTGEILKTVLHGDVKGKKVLIADDICDGGRTFIELAKILKEKGAIEVSLFITHGIFSKGLSVFEGLIDSIYTTDSFREVKDFEKSQHINLNIIEMQGAQNDY